jgi:hypothetical protein
MAGYFRPKSLDDPELAALSDTAAVAWVFLCLEELPRCGIVQPNPRRWSAHSRVPLAEYPACLDAWESLGWIWRDGKYLWIVNYTAHQSKQLQWLGAAKDEALRLISVTKLAQDWLDRYGDIKAISELKSLPKSGVISGPTVTETGTVTGNSQRKNVGRSRGSMKHTPGAP